ncbi:DUF1822 family protein [Phormidium tenue FACHB-886]|nr:DUF1822 family protein [Phormidium tenue FACHB-886]
MLSNSPTASIIVPLSLSAHRLAREFSAHHAEPQKAKQVYLNTMAVSAVRFYLQCMEIETDWAVSQSYDLVMQSMLDVADLVVKQRGTLECRPVLSTDQAVWIPPEVWTDRVGYVAVRLDDALRQAELLGFTAVAASTVPVAQLQSLKDLLAQLYPAPVARLKLTDWLTDRVKPWVEAGWQMVESLGSPSPALSFRSNTQMGEETIQRAKVIDLGIQLGNQPVVLLVAIAPSMTAKSGSGEAPMQEPVEILVQVHPTQGKLYLPADLSLSMLSETGALFQEARSRDYDNYIQLRQFRGVSGECFDIRLAFGDTSIVETFVI